MPVLKANLSTGNYLKLITSEFVLWSHGYGRLSFIRNDCITPAELLQIVWVTISKYWLADVM